MLDQLAAKLSGLYSIERELGRGGMAVVYLADDLRHHRRVALKVLRPELSEEIGRERFLREIQIAARLNHPHILSVHDSGEAGGLLFYVMPFVKGESLRQRIQRDGSLPVEEAVRLSIEICEALAFAHEQSVVHRDIKPENILLVENHAVIADFGIARLRATTDGETLTNLTQSGVFIGTPIYASPEQATGNGSVDDRSDLYSLGVVLYEMLVGDPPFVGSTVQNIIQRKLTQLPPSICDLRPTVPAQVEQITFKAMARISADRFQTCKEFAEALRNATTIGTSKQSFRQDTRFSPRSRLILLIVFILIISAAAVIAWRYAFRSDIDASLRILSADPAPGSRIQMDDLDRGVPIRVVVEHSVANLPVDSKMSVQLWVLVGQPDGENLDGIWKPLVSRAASWETRQLGLTAKLHSSNVLDERITLRAVVVLEDSGALTFTQNSSTLLEYEVEDRH